MFTLFMKWEATFKVKLEVGRKFRKKPNFEPKFSETKAIIY